MANYINSEVLCEAYTHLDIENYSTENSREILEAQLTEFILPRAKFIFNDSVEIKLDFQEGSLKTKLTILGSAASLIACYGDFRESVDQLSRNAVVLAQAANLEVIFKTRTQICDRIRIEKRSGVFGRLSDLLKRAEEIRDIAGHHSFPSSEKALKGVSDQVEQFAAWYRDADKLMEKLESNDTRACVAAGLLEELERFPEQLSWVQDTRGNSFRAKLLNEDVDLASQVDGVAARYSRLLSLAKIQFKKIIELTASKIT